jgi:hypothetical protein
MAPIPVGKNTFSFPDEFAALNKPKIGAWNKGAIGQRLGQFGLVERRAAIWRTRMQPRKARFPL